MHMVPDPGDAEESRPTGREDRRRRTSSKEEIVRRQDPPWVSARPEPSSRAAEEDVQLSETDREGIAAVRRELELEYEARLAGSDADDAPRAARGAPAASERREIDPPARPAPLRRRGVRASRPVDLPETPGSVRAETRSPTSMTGLALAFVLGCIVGAAIAALAITTFVMGRTAVAPQLGATGTRATQPSPAPRTETSPPTRTPSQESPPTAPRAATPAAPAPDAPAAPSTSSSEPAAPAPGEASPPPPVLPERRAPRSDNGGAQAERTALRSAFEEWLTATKREGRRGADAVLPRDRPGLPPSA
jgi:hypothetical protein